MGPENDMANLIEHLLNLSFSSLIEAHPDLAFIQRVIDDILMERGYMLRKRERRTIKMSNKAKNAN
jgi:hypothetical protein